MFEYNDYLMISEEIELCKLASEIDMQLMINERIMFDFDKERAMKEIAVLYNLMSKVGDLMNKAMCHNNGEVYDKCEVYIFEIEAQMDTLRKIYM